MSAANRRAAVLAGLGLLVLVVLFSLGLRKPTTPGAQSIADTPLPARPGDRRAAASGVFVLESLPSQAAVQRSADSPVLRAPPLPFSFFGKLEEGGKPSIILYRGGTTFTVRGPGRLDDTYEVEAVEENFLVLRHVPLGERQVLELKAPAPAVAAPAAPEDTSQD